MSTIYNEEENQFQLVEDPDPYLLYPHADSFHWKIEEQVEKIGGKIFKTRPSDRSKHQEFSISLSSEIHSFFRRNPCEAFAAPFNVRLPVENKRKDNEPTTAVQPDICTFCDEPKTKDCSCIGACDLITEILSPGNTPKEVKRKHEIYVEAQVKAYWGVYRCQENIAVFSLNENGKYDGAKIYAGSGRIKSAAVKGLINQFNDIFTK